MIEMIREIWNLKWWEIFVIAEVDDIFFLVKSWFIWAGLMGVGGIIILLKRIFSK